MNTDEPLTLQEQADRQREAIEQARNSYEGHRLNELAKARRHDELRRIADDEAQYGRLGE